MLFARKANATKCAIWRHWRLGLKDLRGAKLNPTTTAGC
jgi:hypothetical protein